MSIIRKIIGLLLLIASIIGLIFSIGGISVLWQIEPNITAGIESSIDLLSQTLETTSQGLGVTQVALKSSVDTISGLQTTVETIATTVNSSSPMVGDIQKMITVEVPNTIRATESSLLAAQSSAAIIDSVLGSLSGIPLIGGAVGYNPDVPLSDALGQVAESLNSLPDSLMSMEANLTETHTNLETFESDLTVMAESIGQIQSSVAQYDTVILGYKGSLDQIKNSLTSVKTSLPTYVRYLIMALTVFLIWMGIANLGLLTQGWELLTESKPRKTEKPEAEPEVHPGKELQEEQKPEPEKSEE